MDAQALSLQQPPTGRPNEQAMEAQAQAWPRRSLAEHHMRFSLRRTVRQFSPQEMHDTNTICSAFGYPRFNLGIQLPQSRSLLPLSHNNVHPDLPRSSCTMKATSKDLVGTAARGRQRGVHVARIDPGPVPPTAISKACCQSGCHSSRRARQETIAANSDHTRIKVTILIYTQHSWSLRPWPSTICTHSFRRRT